MKTVKNYTPHEVIVLLENGSEVKFPSVGIARVASKEEFVEGDLGLPETVTTYGQVEGLPAPEAGVVYIVSRLVLAQCADRTDLRVPGLQVRDQDGRVIGCKSLARN